jgi:hypothetical protein
MPSRLRAATQPPLLPRGILIPRVERTIRGVSFMQGRIRGETLFAAALAFMAVVPMTRADDLCATRNTPDNLKYVQYFQSRVQDAAGCAMRVVDGRIVVDQPVTNPALTCPDMFAWKLFAEGVTAQFWRNWAADQEVWPGNGLVEDPGRPLPLCAPGLAADTCCNPDAPDNPGYDDKAYKAKNCPYFPGDHAMAPGSMVERFGMLPSKAHDLGFAKNPRRDAKQGRVMLTAPDPARDRAKGRHVRQSVAEVIFHNKAFFDFVFRHDLYNTEGVVKVFNANAANIGGLGGVSHAPYRLADGNGAIATINFPADAVMIKSDWISRARAEELGLKDDPQNPYVKMNISSPELDDNGAILQPGEHWLVAIHFSSKDIPNWVWTTFEHVNNPGRCDFTGCNDSYGYASPDKLAPNVAHNFTRPHQICDSLPLPAYVPDIGGTYQGGERQSGLADVFATLRIGTTDNKTLVPQPTDRAWLSYRLKGTQVEFVDATGRSTRLGNSVTEAGFMASSSCMTCHARAGTNATGTVPLPLGIFETGLSEQGYLPSSSGIPLADWYNRSGQPPALQVLQTDFVWGFIMANPIHPPPVDASVPRGPLSRSARERALAR